MIQALFLSLLVFVPLPKVEQPSTQKPPEIVRENPKLTPPVHIASSPFVIELNDIRIKSGFKPLQESATLNQSAQAWANRTSVSVPHSDFGW